MKAYGLNVSVTVTFEVEAGRRSGYTKVQIHSYRVKFVVSRYILIVTETATVV